MPNTKGLVSVTYPRLLVYGGSGTGKTHFVGTCPKPYVFDFDNGIETLSGMDVEFDFYEPTTIGTWDRFSKKLREFERGAVKGIQTVAVDSLTAMCDAAETEVMNMNRRTLLNKTQQDWGQEITMIEQIMYRLNTVSKHYHVVVTAHEEVRADEVSGETFVVPIVSGKRTPFALPKFFSEVYRLYTERTKEKRPAYQMLTCADRRYSAKSRLGGLDPVETPDYGALMQKYTNWKPKASGEATKG